MRYSALAFVLACAAVAITGCRQQQAGGQPRPSQDRGKSQGEHNPQALQESPGGNDAHPSDQAPAGDDPKADQGNGPDEEPLLLLDDDAPLLLDDEPPLLLDEEPPLLLDDGGGESLTAGPVADNSRCHHCHLNYVDEDLVVVHADANIGCADCHGKCDEHIADESWASGGNGTPPEIMYPREKINPFCLDCHPKDEIDDLEHERFLAGTAGEKYCTDCHGDHRLAERKCKWK